VKLATTTSTENSGLLEVLLPPFEQRHNVKVDVIAVGTGKALALGRNGDVDVVLVHAPDAEEEFVESGFGVNRRPVMYNHFVIIGPAEDPAGIRELGSGVKAMERVAANLACFVSRGDDSGTDKKEKALWKAAGISPEGSWYVETGQGMGATLRVADEKRGYTLTDRGTYLAFRDKINMEVLCEGGKAMLNPYSIIVVNPLRHPHVRYMESMMLIAWTTSPEGREIISRFKVGAEQLFQPLPAK
jgi:tungstate transport system substrate-binding protein